MRHSRFIYLMTVVACASAFTLPATSEEETSTPAIPSPERGAINRDVKALSPVTTMSTAGKDTFTETRPRLVLALSGGAYKAVAEIGALRSLEQHHIKIDGIVGTSMGATIGSLYCAGVSVDQIEAMFLDGTIQNAMMKGARWSVMTRPIAPLLHIFTGRPYAGITDGEGYLQLLKQKLPASFEQLKIPFAAVVTNLTDGQTAVLAHGDLPKAVLASSCVPTFYRPQMIDGKLYVDGGLKANLPSDIAQSMGADVVVAVLVDNAVTSVPNKKFKSKNALIFRVMDIMTASSDKMQSRSSDTLIYPDVDFVPWLTKDPGILRRGIAAGQKATDSVAARIASELITLRQSHKEPTAEAKGPWHEVTSR